MSTEKKTVLEETTTATGDITIQIVSSRGGNRKITFPGGKWSALKSILIKDYNYDMDNLKAVENFRRTTLEHPEAVVPNVDFTLFLMPYKSKSGSDRSAVTATIKEFIVTGGEAAKAHFNAGKNYTNKSTSELQELVQSYGKTSSKKDKGVHVQGSKQDSKGIKSAVAPAPKAKAKVVPVAKGDNSLIIAKLDEILEILKAGGVPVNDSAAKIATAKVKNTALNPNASDSDLNSEMRELASHFKDVRI
jgi:hypothetical protein